VNQKPNSKKGTSPVATLSTSQLAHLLRASSAGWYAAEAATQLLCEHRSLLTRADFLAACVEYDHDGTEPVAWVVWDDIPGYVARAPLSSSEEKILRIAAELGGRDTGVPLAELLTGLDDSNAQLVLDAIAHVVRLGPEGNRR
jgi:hypothetical protein